MTTITLDKLIPWKDNVRKTGIGDGIGELAASIAAHGLLQSLVVRKAAHGKFAVIAGQRRLRALSLLVGDGKIPADLPVECRVVSGDADVIEIGLAENVVRVPMHPADQFEAFRDLIDKGSACADVAARFGVSESIVTKRLKLGRVSPTLLTLYRDGAMSLEQVQAFTVCDDREAQERVWAALPDWNRSPGDIREALTEGEIPATDKRVRLVTLEAYEAAGGAVRRDLFDDGNSGYVLDVPLLDRLVHQALTATAETVAAEGWKWTEIQPEFGHEERTQFQRRFPEDTPLPEAEAAELERLTGEYDELAGLLQEDPGNAEMAAQLEQTERRIETLSGLGKVWTDEVKTLCGAVVCLSRDGAVAVERGLLRDEDLAGQDEVDEPGSAGDEPEAPAALPSTLVADLTAQRTAAIAACMARQPDIALAAVTHALTRRVFFRNPGETPLKIEATIQPLRKQINGPDECRGLTALAAGHEKWAAQLPADADRLWDWCLSQPGETLLALLAVCAAHTLDAVRTKGTRPDAAHLLLADRMADALRLDMKDWFTPTASGFFSRISRDGILEAVSEATGKPRARSWSKLKKAAMAAHAEKAISGTGWLPAPLLPHVLTAQAEEIEPELMEEAA